MNPCVEKYKNFFKSVAEAENIKNYVVDVTGHSNPADGLLGDHYHVKITGENRQINIFAKTIKEEDNGEVEILRRVFQNEFYFYKTVYPELNGFSTRNNVEPFVSIPKHYHLHEEILLLEDLSADGYEMHDKKKTLDVPHTSIVLDELAHLHAVSIAFKSLEPRLFSEIVKNIHCVNVTEGKVNFETTVKYLCEETLSLLTLADDGDVYYKMMEFSNDVEEFLSSISSFDDELCVITHGDVYTNNIMFKYQDIENPKTPTGVRFFDWQLMRYGSPVLDIAHFLFSSCDGSVLANVDDVLSRYKSTLRRYLAKFGINGHERFDPVFDSHWRTFARYGLAVSTVIYKVILFEPDDFIECDARSMLEHFSRKFRNYELYKSKIKQLVYWFVENKLLEVVN